jgi:Met-10+ like-protein
MSNGIHIVDVLRANIPEDKKVPLLLQLLGAMRSQQLSAKLLKKIGPVVKHGPFTGLTFIPELATGNLAANLLGCYEHELHEAIETIIATPYKVVVDIGSAFGYYAVGLARRMPGAMVYAYDIDPAQQRATEALAALNGVAERVRVGGECRGGDFVTFPARQTVVICDIEGDEVALLNPLLYPALTQLDMLVELHSANCPDIETIFLKLFEKTHDITVIRGQAKLYPLSEIFGLDPDLNLFDDFLAAHDLRGGPTPWLFMRARSKDNQAQRSGEAALTP